VSPAPADPGPPSGPRAVVLLTSVAHEAFGAGLDRPGVDWLTMEVDGALHDGGGIGTEVAVRARAFGARVIGCRRHPSADDPSDRTVTPDRLPEVVGQADVIVLAAPSTPDTANLVDASLLARVRPGATFVNVARGTLVDEDALLEALDRGRPAVAVLDVFRQEPLPEDHPFWTHPSVRITPHNAAGGSGRLLRQAELFSDNLDRYLAGRPLVHDVTDEIAGRGH
jgi:phosphoglycerate dehydrogenase-like enzyme